MDVWKASARLSVSVYRELANSKEFSFKDQITRAGLSIPSNIAEGFGRSTDRDKRNFLNYARGSCAEFRSQTYIGMRAGIIERSIGASWIDESNRISAMLTRLMTYLSENKGTNDKRPMTNDYQPTTNSNKLLT
jgi:four helix bundle protein